MELAYRATALVPTGVPGRASVLAGGYAENRVQLVEGRPGSGKTSMALQLPMDTLAQLIRRLVSKAGDVR
jgi:KaiC/GvpD/RAD55 family RecA-like ATPase